MDDFLLVGTTQLGTPIYMSELSQETLRDNDLCNDPAGLYLYEAAEGPHSLGIRVLATVPNPEAAFRILDLLGVRVGSA